MDSHMALISVATGLSIEKSLECVKIFKLKQQLEEADLMKIVIFIIKNFCDSFNLKESMNALQIVEAANEFIERYSHESLEDFILCLKKAKNGQYGPVYNRIDRTIIFEFWMKYLIEKSSFLENKSLNYKSLESNQLLGTGANVPENAKKAFSKLLTNIQRSMYKPSIQKQKSSYNSVDEYLTELKAWLPTAKKEDIEFLKKDASLKNARYVLEVIEKFELANENL
jgi:hypothetical protein